jgi:hypothetical protein
MIQLLAQLPPQGKGKKIMKKLVRTIFVNEVEKTERVNEFQLQFFVDTVLSNPINKRYRESFEGKNLLEVFSFMTKTLDAKDMVQISNGTKTVELTVNDWKSIIKANLAVFNNDTVSINVKGKVSIKPEIELNTL